MSLEQVAMLTGLFWLEQHPLPAPAGWCLHAEGLQKAVQATYCKAAQVALHTSNMIAPLEALSTNEDETVAVPAGAAKVQFLPALRLPFILLWHQHHAVEQVSQAE